jgi:hypothetical protein
MPAFRGYALDYDSPSPKAFYGSFGPHRLNLKATKRIYKIGTLHSCKFMVTSRKIKQFTHFAQSQRVIMDLLFWQVTLNSINIESRLSEGKTNANMNP